MVNGDRACTHNLKQILNLAMFFNSNTVNHLKSLKQHNMQTYNDSPGATN
jgi:hypothetical protein